MIKPNSIRLRRREGRNIYVFQREGSDLFELEEVPPQFADPGEWVKEVSAFHPKPPPLPRHRKPRPTPQDQPEGDSWSRASITALARTINNE